MNNYKSDTSGETIPVCIIEFRNGFPDLWYHKQDWDEAGGYHKIIKDMQISPRDIEKVHKICVHPHRFPTNEWEP